MRSFVTSRRWGKDKVSMVGEVPIPRSEEVYRALRNIYSYNQTLDEAGFYRSEPAKLADT